MLRNPKAFARALAGVTGRVQTFGRQSVQARMFSFTPKTWLLLNKDNKNDSDDDDKKEESFKEQLGAFWKNPKYKYSLLIALAVLGLGLSLSENVRDLIGIELGMYHSIGVSVDLLLNLRIWNS